MNGDETDSCPLEIFAVHILDFSREREDVSFDLKMEGPGHPT